MEDQNNQKFHKNDKNRLNEFKEIVDVIKLCHDTKFNFFPNNGVLLSWTTVEQSAKM